MTPEKFQSAARQFIVRFDDIAHLSIGAWRDGGERIGEATRKRWDTAFAESSPKLSKETRHNATRAQQAFAGYYNKGIALSASGAETAVDTLVQAARSVLERAGTQRTTRA